MFEVRPAHVFAMASLEYPEALKAFVDLLDKDALRFPVLDHLPGDVKIPGEKVLCPVDIA